MLSDEEARLKVDGQRVENVQVVLRGQALVQLGRYKPSIFFENVSSPLWVISGHDTPGLRCPLYPQQRTSAAGLQCPLSANSGHRRIYSITLVANASIGAGTAIPRPRSLARRPTVGADADLAGMFADRGFARDCDADDCCGDAPPQPCLSNLTLAGA